ncbi:MAG: response regulator [Candidatus Marinimicrobia bacterium]|nr:response regulator [Candidatus Neomarinimicrobiota bacterium]
MKKHNKYFTTGDIASYCAVDTITVKNWIMQGILNAFKTPAGHDRISSGSFLTFIEEYGHYYIPDFFGDINNGVDVLVIDDDSKYRDLIEYQLNSQFNNLVIKTADNGFDGYMKLNQHKPKLVFLDLMMPGITGVELLRNIREKKELTHVSIYIISAYIDNDVIQELNELNIKVILNKPVNHRQLINECSEILA